MSLIWNFGADRWEPGVPKPGVPVRREGSVSGPDGGPSPVIDSPFKGVSAPRPKK
jgi:hypothetical protein